MYANSRQTTSIRASHYRPGHHYGWTSATATTTTELGRHFTPPSRPRSWIAPAAGLATALFLTLLLVTGGVLTQSPPDPTAVLLLIPAGVATLGLGLLTTRRLLRPNATANAARRAWRSAWYCGRCDGVFFPAAAAAMGIPTGRLISPAALSQTLRRVCVPGHSDARA